MQFSIAINSVLYLLIFIFPGILFRKFFFQGNFSHEFSQGNFLEKVIWSILFSAILIIEGIVIRYFLQSYLELNLFGHIDYNSLKIHINSLLENKLPEKTFFIEHLPRLLYFILYIYALSISMGILAHILIHRTRLSNLLPSLRYKHHWYYRFNGSNLDREKTKGKNYLYTIADVLVIYKEKLIVYRGIVNEFSINHSNNNLETLTLTDTEKLDINNDLSETCNGKKLKGNFLCLKNDNIQNINLTYVFKEKIRNYSLISNLINIVFIISFSLSINILWIDINYLRTLFQKCIFLIITFINLGLLKEISSHFFGIKNIESFSKRNSLLSIILFSTAYLYFLFNNIKLQFSFLNQYPMISFCIVFIFTAILINIFYKTKKQPNEDN